MENPDFHGLGAAIRLASGDGVIGGKGRVLGRQGQQGLLHC